jgi:4-hydroxythreonine-4-phosphate dehydrogenase
MGTPLPLALTMGDPSGIGPDIALAAWMGRATNAIPPFIMLADPAMLAARARVLGLAVPIICATPEDAVRLFDKALPVLPLESPVTDTPGLPDSANAPAIIQAITDAVRLTREGKTCAVVTNPIAKHVLAASGFGFPGHTEFLAHLADQDGLGPYRPVMLIWSELLAVVPVTIHMAIKDVPQRLTTDLIIETGRIVDRDYRTRFGIKHPRLALCGLNPHAGEGGLMGLEDDAIIAPAVLALQAEGIAARGPLPADTMFHPRARAEYDVALGMYHDQVLVPVKTLAFDDGVNVTLGLPFIRTSPDHGTAFSLAGTGAARPDSLIAALKLAARLAETE